MWKLRVKIKKEEIKQVAPEKTVEENKTTQEKWVRVKMIETGDVNGKQIDKGVVLDVKEEDAKKLVDSKKAIIDVEEIKKQDKTEEKTEAKAEEKTETKAEEKTEAKAEENTEAKAEEKTETKAEEKKDMNYYFQNQDQLQSQLTEFPHDYNQLV